MNTKFLFFGLLFISLFSCNKEKKGEKPVVQDIKELVFASGELQWDNAYNLTAQTDGILLNANFEVGNELQKGSTVAQIDNRNNEINTQTQQEQLAIANENITPNSPAVQQLKENRLFLEGKLKQDQLQADRLERLFATQSVAKLEVENAQLVVKNTVSQLNALKKQEQYILQQAQQQHINAKSQLKNNQVTVGYNRIVVPQNGTVIKKMKSNGDYVRKGDVIATIADNEKVEIVLNVDENSIGKVQIGQLVYVQFNTNKNKVLNGKVSEILSAFDVQTQSFLCKVILDETLPSSIFGTQLEANILVGEKKNALLVPRKYVGFGNKVQVQGKEEPIIVKTGIISSDFVEILEGVTANDVVTELKM